MLLFLLLFFFLPYLEGASIKVEVSAKGAILMNAETGAVLYEKNAHQPMFPASITKIVTALYALEKKTDLSLKDVIVADNETVATVAPHVRRVAGSKHPSHRLEYGGTHMGIKVGEALSFEVLLYGLMLASGNDAANTIAHYVSGSVPQFMHEVNAYAKSKGCTQTHLCNPHGLPWPDHVTTAYDMALLAREAVKNPLLCKIVKTVKCTRPATNMQPESFLYQHNALVKPGSKFYYPKAMGIKTGYTSAGGYTIVAAAEDPQRKLICVLLGCDQLEQRYKDAIALFEAAFNEKKMSRTLFSKEFDSFSSSIKGGKTLLEAVLPQDLIVEYFASEEQTFHSQIQWDDAVSLPIRRGQKVGQVRIVSEEKTCALSPLFALKDVEPTFAHSLWMRWTACKKWISYYLSWVLGLFGFAILAGTFYLSRSRKSSKN
ncbi:MAG TPA: D-alanyl-D-alanine carboxypeptidase family protein [Rhabdochlamydiaceae bacterium]|jgi:D-alanyl-D-alanine carboxypeptidase (penicillin-binding protein 5/6)